MPVTPIRPKGPPLNALRAFEAAARLGGFSAAAEELCVTPGAVAQHIKTLETWAKAPLFERRSQGVELTLLGSAVAVEFEEAFDQMGAAVQSLRVQASSQVVRIAALPSIAQLWLSPLLPKIRTALPDVEISVTVLERAPNLHRESFDLCLFFDTKKNDAETVCLATEEIFPVCSPALAAKLKAPGDLSSVPCLHDTSWQHDWDNWINTTSSETPIKVKGPGFSLYSMAVDEALHGAGVLIGHSPLVDRHLKAGTLVKPFSKSISTGRSLTLTQTSVFAKSPIYNAILNVLCDQNME